MLKNNLTEKTGKQTFTQFIGGVNVKAQLNNIFKNEKECSKFVASIASAVSTNPSLSECDYPTIISSALLANALNMPLSPQLGLCYLVPFDDKKRGRKVATFVLGYRGYIQLAIRSGYYTDLDVTEIKEGEYVGRDEETGKCRFHFITDDAMREELETVGYMAYFTQANGFKKVLFWSKEKMLKHADRYSAAFSLAATNGKFPKVSYADYAAGKYPKEDEWKYSSFWYKDFDAMAFKTMLRQLISKWGIMSVDMQKAFESDGDGEQSFDFVTPTGEDLTVAEKKEPELLPETAKQEETEENAEQGEQSEQSDQEEQFDFYGEQG